MGPPDSHGVPRAPRYSGSRYASSFFGYRTFTVCGAPFQALPLVGFLQHRGPTTPPPPRWGRFGLLPGRSPLLGESRLFSLPPGTKMFQFPGFASRTGGMAVRQTAGLPHSDIRGSQVACTSPRLFAACRVLRRLPEPRHPPCALGSFRRASGDWPPRAYLGFYLRVLVLVRTINLYVVVCLHRGVNPPGSLLLFQHVNERAGRAPRKVENNGFEPLTPCVQSRCSSQLS